MHEGKCITVNIKFKKMILSFHHLSVLHALIPWVQFALAVTQVEKGGARVRLGTVCDQCCQKAKGEGEAAPAF